MIRLKNAHRGQRAVVISGGPSLLAKPLDLGHLRDRGFVTFLETKALTPWLLRSGLTPDYFLMPFPEKAKDNALQTFVYRSFLAEYRIDRHLAPQCRHVASEMRARQDEYFEGWRPHRGIHKRLRWRPGVYLQDSPYELLRRLPATRIIVNKDLIGAYFPDFEYEDRAFYFTQDAGEPTFDLDKYFNPAERDGVLRLRCADTFHNSAAITLYPLLNHLGFQEVYFLGMDMSLLGSFEYAAPYTFRSMLDFWWFFRRTRHAFSGNYKHNWLFRRPKSEFQDLCRLWSDSPVKFTRVYEPWKYATPVSGIRTISFDQFNRE